MRKVEKSTDVTEVSFRIILHAGNGKGSAMEAIQAAKAGSFEQADELIEEAGRELAKAHEFQTNLIQQEANGGRTELNVLLIHSQDHLMTSMTVRDLAIEIIEIYRTKRGLL
ncbi:PTS lactose/cellobiose transporter subunit IIA [Shouchella clausii]|uniref:PTS lactose/cellobiose transporter subunit IIA n=1 Tax=Shouchella clausii TaxID=79880 RepID=UPI0009E248E0|nr:PTS lactose/cellobiose transporter subunit IIA [Shouchella clausii]